ncbi:hypothetical protein HDZ31DRAFT_70777, partial [Schizophyllum fasciatum]
RLVELDIHASSDITVTDEDWAALVPSWPCLEVFRLLPLRELALHLHLGPVPALARELKVGTSGLRKLDIGRYPAFSRAVPANIAAFLRLLFPNLCDLQIASCRGVDVYVWDQIKRFLALASA